MFGLDSLIPIGLSLAGGLAGSKSKMEPYTVEQTPYWLKEFPEYKQGYQQLLADYMTNVYNKPYQPSSYMRRAEASDSPYLQQIQTQIDNQIQNPQATEAPVEQAPQQDPAQMRMIADAQIGREMYARSNTDPMFGYGIKGGRLSFQDKVGPNATDEDFALASRMWNAPAAEKANFHTPGVDASAAAKNVLAGLNTGNLKNTNNINIGEMLQKLTGSAV